MDTVAIVGVGLIGASFGLALRKAGFHGRILGVSSPSAVQPALARGAIDEALPLERAVPQADLVYLSQPIQCILDTIPRLGPFLKAGALVTDAGSTKARIDAEARRALPAAQFLGGHPMAGKEKRGAAEADPDLFAGRPYVLTPAFAEQMETESACEFAGWVRAIGAVPIVLKPADHDRIVAFTSHVPQLLSTGLAATLAGRLGEAELNVAGPGLHDMTRLAGSAYEIWRDILDTNAEEIEPALDACISTLRQIRRELREDRVRHAFEAGNAFSARLRRPAAPAT